MFKNFLAILCAFFLINHFSYAQTIQANYDVHYGIVGKIGTTVAVLKKDKHRYTIDIQLEATGLAKILSADRKEHHISKGHIKRGLMISDLYQVIKSYGSVVINKEYRIDHQRKRVHKTYTKYREGKQVSQKNSVLNFYSEDDLLTLYFNLDKRVKNKTTAKTYLFQAVGAERQQGKVTVVVPKQSDLVYYKKVLGETFGWYATAIIHQKIFMSKEGRLMLSVGKDGITDKAVLKDVIFFGDITAIRTKGTSKQVGHLKQN